MASYDRHTPDALTQTSQFLMQSMLQRNAAQPSFAIVFETGRSSVAATARRGAATLSKPPFVPRLK